MVIGELVPRTWPSPAAADRPPWPGSNSGFADLRWLINALNGSAN